MFGGKKKQKHVVVSHASGDRGEALALAAELEAGGVRVWIASRDIVPTQGTANQIQEAIRASVAVLLIVSANANASKVLKTEAELAVGHAPIVPVRIEDVAPARALHSLVQGQDRYDLFGDARTTELARLVDASLHLLGPARSTRSLAAPVSAPRAEPDAPPAPPAPPGTPSDISSDTAPAEAIETAPHATPVHYTRTLPLTHIAALRHYVCPRGGRILDHWREMDVAGTVDRRFLAGLVFGRYWLAWRKLRLAALALSAVTIALIGLALWADDRGLAYGPPAALLGIVGLGGIVALRGLGMYRTAAERQIERWNTPDLNADEAAAALRSRGGTSPLTVLALLALEVAACAALAVMLDPALVILVTTSAKPDREQSLDLVDMTRPADPNVYYNLCVHNPTDLTITFTMRYATGATDKRSIGPRSKSLTFWTRSPDAPSISFDHVLGDGAAYSDRTYALNMAKTDSQHACGGMIYYFTASNGDIDLKREEQMVE